MREIDKKMDDAEARDAIKAALADWFDAARRDDQIGPDGWRRVAAVEPGFAHAGCRRSC